MDEPRPFVSTGLVAVTCAAWIAAAAFGLHGLADRFGFVPGRVWGASATPLNALTVWLTPLSATLVHGGLMHLFFNLMMLGFVGRFVEPVLGSWRFLLLYVLGAYAAAAGQWIAGPSSLVPMIGASGAISAVVAAHATIYGQRKPAARWPFSADFLNMAWLAAAWTALQYLTTHAIRRDIATAAHIGGFVAGLVLTGLITRPVEREAPQP